MSYIITATPAEAFEAFVDERVRYAAHLTDGRGFVAYDGPRTGLPVGATLEPHPDYPPSWPQKDFPKRGYSTGFERFAITSTDIADLVMTDPTAVERVTGVALLGEDRVLIETDAWAVPLAIWSAGVESVLDKRLEPVT